jgi:hypothetical protein
MKNKTLWKSMKSGMMSDSGSLGPWKFGEWRKHTGELEMCKSGFHASVRAIDAMHYVNCEVLALVEVRGGHLEQDNKQVWESMRVVKAYEWTKPDSVAMSIYAAELVIGIYEKEYPDDKRPRKAIEAAKAWLENPTDENKRFAAYAASAASYAAASYAASAASAASAAAYAAYAASADAYAASADAYAASAAASRSARSATLNKIEAWIQERIKTLTEVA